MCVDWSSHSIDGSRVIISPHFPVGIPPYSIFILFVYLCIYIYPDCGPGRAVGLSLFVPLSSLASARHFRNKFGSDDWSS
jgi:hypothetical protein